MPLESSFNIVRWLDGLKRIPAWSDPWPATADLLRFQRRDFRVYL
jgi:hypothetical protein